MRGTKRFSWAPKKDPLGSDYLPIKISLILIRDAVTSKKVVTYTECETFRAVWAASSADTDLKNSFRIAAQQAKRRIKVKIDTRTPDKHLLTLLDKILAAIKRRRADRTMSQRYAIDRTTKEARPYKQKLRNERWQRDSDPFNKRTDVEKVCYTFQVMLAKSKFKNTAENFLLHLRCELEELADHINEIAFAQPSMTRSPAYAHSHLI